MALSSPPSFDALERLSRTRDADLIRSKQWVDPDRVKGRGAQSNRAGRFEKETRETVDDGWTPVEPIQMFETIEHIERAKTIITRNESPDIGFDRSINAYRGCEHGCIYCFARPTHAFHDLSPGLDFETRLFAKPEAATLLRKELGKAGYRVRPIAMGT